MCMLPLWILPLQKNSRSGQTGARLLWRFWRPCICHQLLSVSGCVQHPVPMHTGPEECGRCWGLQRCMGKWKTPARNRENAHTRCTLEAPDPALRRRATRKSACETSVRHLPKSACFWRRKEVKCSYIGRRMQRREERGPFPFSGMAGEAACFTQGGVGDENL